MAYIRPYRGKWRAEVQKHGQRRSKLVETEADAKLWATFTEADLDAGAGRYRVADRLAQNGPDLVTLVPKCVLDACREIPHSHADVRAAAIPTSKASGVYFLLQGVEVVYVGQSLDVLHRIARHRREGRLFDAFSYIECDPQELDRLEALYIRAFVPQGNLTFGNRRGQTPRPGSRRTELRGAAIADSSALTSAPPRETPEA